MSYLDDISKEWDKFEFSLEPTKEGMKDLLKMVAVLQAYSMANEAVLISYLAEIKKTTKEEIHKEILSWYERFFAEISASRFGKHGH